MVRIAWVFQINNITLYVVKDTWIYSIIIDLGHDILQTTVANASSKCILQMHH